MRKAIKSPLLTNGSITQKKYYDQSEEFLFRLFSRPEEEICNQIFDLLNERNDWALHYHLSPVRHQLLDWYDFNSKGNLLDIGSGCGSMVGLFCKHVSSVVSLELTDIRAEIIKKRFKNNQNLKVFCGSIEDYKVPQKFDYINLTGVLEYWGMYAKNKNILESFNTITPQILSKINKILKSKGTLFIAIENPIGLKYLAGTVEDHYAQLFEGVENYPNYNGIRTFTKLEMLRLLSESGFANIQVYYPFPDYKMPWVVLHEDFLAQYNNNLNSLFESVNYEYNPNYYLFSEVLLAYQLKKEGILSSFGNSFLFVATKD